MTIDELFKSISEKTSSELLKSGENNDIGGISFDSRRAQNGDIFFCKGANFKVDYALNALKKGINALCFEKALPYAEEILSTAKKNHPKTTILQTKNIKRTMALCSDIFYRHPFSKLTSIAVTGTKGKTTTVQMICDVINQASDFRGAILNSFLPNGAPFLTTPESPDLFFCAGKCADMGYTHLICEISSQAIKEERIFGINFDIACFLNFGCDHISPHEHTDEQDYFNCKKQLFLSCGCAVLSSDCPKTPTIINAIKEHDSASKRQKKTDIYTFGFNSDSDFFGKNIQKTAEGCIFSVEHQEKTLDLCVTNGGARGAQNALCAFSVGTLSGATEREIFNGIAASRAMGRMEKLTSFDKRIDVVIDYAHNKMSFEAVFEGAKELGKPITAVFGCPGDKAFCRRKELPEIALRYADRIILTEDDSSFEGFDTIKNDMLKNISLLISANPEIKKRKLSSNISVISDRKTAIENSLISAIENNEFRTVLILGKGCEQSMLTENGSVFYEGDHNVARKTLENYAFACESAIMLANAKLFRQKLTILVKNEKALDNLFFSLELLPKAVSITVICPENLSNAVRLRCFKQGRLEKVFEAFRGEIFRHGDGIRFYIAPQNADFEKIASDIAFQSHSDLLAYMISERGILLNGTGFVKNLSLSSARLIEKNTNTPYISHLISALDRGVRRCAVLDEASKMSIARLVSGLEFAGSEIKP